MNIDTIILDMNPIYELGMHGIKMFGGNRHGELVRLNKKDVKCSFKIELIDNPNVYYDVGDTLIWDAKMD